MRKIGAALAMVLAVCPMAAMAQDSDVPMGYGSRISEADSCFSMRQRVLAVSDDRTAVVTSPGVRMGGVMMNASGRTERSTQASHDIAAGDRACEANNRARAASYYQHAIDELTSQH